MKIKSIITALFLAAVFLLPVSLNAQSDGFFRGGESENYSNRDGGPTAGIQNNGIGQPEAPLGSGLLILSAVGAGYAIARRKRNLKKGATLLLAALMLLGMTNCHKNLETVNPAPSNGVYITLNVDGGSKVIVEPEGASHPSWATVTWEDDDLIYVGNNGAYCGYLTYNSSTKKFGGTITPTSGDDGDYLHFYFMGNKGPEGQPSSVNITDQTSKYPVISYGRSTSLYNSSTASYEATLYNKCAIVKFNTTNIDKAITITGMMNTVTVDFTKNGIGDPVNPYSYLSSGNGEIRLHAGANNTERWAILLPQSEVTTATAYAVGYTTTDNFTVDAVSTNDYFTNNNSIELTSGSPKGAFTINASGDQVFFAPGNLQATYNGSSWSWAFAPNQWSYIGKAAGNTNVTSTSPWISTPGTVDLFGWSTSSTYFGINSNSSNGTYTGTFVDWGTNIIGYDAANTWRTLTKDEWDYLFNSRTTKAGTAPNINGTKDARYAKAYLFGTTRGVILFPDGYTHPDGVVSPTGINKTDNTSWSANQYNASDWASMEAAGAVFLPDAGYRMGTSPDGANSYGIYWSSYTDDDSWAYGLQVVSSNLQFSYWTNRSNGFSVRLVRPVE